MHPKPIDILNFSNSSLLSTQEYKIDSGNLHITDLSFGRNNREIIPLDLIDPKPKITKKSNEQLMWTSVGSFTVGLLFILLSLSFENQIQQSMGIGFLAISAIFLIASLKLQTTSYTYYYANTTAHLFTINEPQTGEKDIVIKFIQSLNQRINKPKLKGQRNFKKEERSEFFKHLDFLYNFGVLTDAQYERIHSKINVKIYGAVNETRKTADIIQLPIKRC